MRLNKKETELIYELTDKLTDRVFRLHEEWIQSEETQRALWELFKKARFELKGY